MSSPKLATAAVCTLLIAFFAAADAHALDSDRQQPLELRADDTQGSLGDGTTVLDGRVEIRQGTLHIQADQAEVNKNGGKIQVIIFRGAPAKLEQEIEEQGLVQAEANTITYQVAAGTVELAGSADVTHPQYHITGEKLTYDLNRQHFEGTGRDSADGRIRIRMEPEVAETLQARDAQEPSSGDNGAASQDPEGDGDADGEGAP